MLWHGRTYGCGLLLPEKKKANMWLIAAYLPPLVRIILIIIPRFVFISP